MRTPEAVSRKEQRKETKAKEEADAKAAALREQQMGSPDLQIGSAGHWISGRRACIDCCAVHALVVVLCCACNDCCAVQLKIQYQQLNLWLKIRLPSLQWTRIQCWMCRIRQCTLLESIDPSHHRRWHHWRQWITAGHLLQCQIDGLDSCRN